MSIINKIKKVSLVGCGGACFPTALKWSMVKKANGKSPSIGSGQVKFVICNASEGEPNVEKDGYILKNFPEKVIDGMALALSFLEEGGKVCAKGYFYINHNYSKKYSKKLKAIIKKRKLNIELFIKPDGSGYIGGEETTILNLIEGKRGEPRLRPPYPTTNGLWNAPTIVNNVETLYHVSLINDDLYDGERFYSINGDCLKKGVYKLPGSFTIERILKETNNVPKFNFFVQVGGGASGEVLNNKQLKRKASGAMSLTLYKINKKSPREVIKDWVRFFVNESCGQCTPCREGNYRLLEILEDKNPNWDLFSDLLENLEQTSFCGLGCIVPVPIESYIRNVLDNKEVKIKGSERKTICKCFK